MSTPKQRLLADRANRNAAHAVFDTRLARIKADVHARGIGSRMAGTVADEVSGVVDAARESKVLIAGALGALLLWVFRHPLMGAAAATFEHFAGNGEETEDETQ